MENQESPKRILFTTDISQNKFRLKQAYNYISQGEEQVLS